MRRKGVRWIGRVKKNTLCGKTTEGDLIALGYPTSASLKGADPEEIYRRDCLRRGLPVDRCQLYVYRMCVYYAQTPNPDPEKLKWWYWKDKK